MQASWSLYFRMSLLFITLSAAMGFHYGRHGFQRHPKEAVWHVPVSDAARGRSLITHYGCGACHVVPGVGGATGNVGPKLDRLQQQIYLPGGLPHTPHNLVAWIREPRQIDPLTAMPTLGIREQDARDLAAYLYSAQP